MDPSQNPNVFHATTICSVRRNGQVVIAGDGQVTLGHTVMKANARKVRRLGKDGRVLAGFAGAAHHVGVDDAAAGEHRAHGAAGLLDDHADLVVLEEHVAGAPGGRLAADELAGVGDDAGARAGAVLHEVAGGGEVHGAAVDAGVGASASSARLRAPSERHGDDEEDGGTELLH